MARTSISITLDNDHVGVSNGIRSGSPRAGIEAYTWDSTGTVAHGWSNLKIINCVFEAADEFTIDLADCYRVSTVHSGPALISGCTIMGGGKSSNAYWGYSICVEGRSASSSRTTRSTAPRTTPSERRIGGINSNDPGPIIRDNVFDLTYDNGITSSAPYFCLRGSNVQFTGNTIIASQGIVFELENLVNSVVTGNTITLGAARLFFIGAGCSSNVISPNSTH